MLSFGLKRTTVARPPSRASPRSAARPIERAGFVVMIRARDHDTVMTLLQERPTFQQQYARAKSKPNISLTRLSPRGLSSTSSAPASSS